MGYGSCAIISALQIPTMPIESQLAEYQGYLLRYARLQLRNDAWAEDAVSETMLAALSKPQSFGNRSQLKTWLVGILKHKVIDILRQRRREVSLADDEGDGKEHDPVRLPASLCAACCRDRCERSRSGGTARLALLRCALCLARRVSWARRTTGTIR